MSLLQRIGMRLARYLSKPRGATAPIATIDPQRLAQALRPADVLLIDGTSRFSVAIKYLTQSSWSHAALYIGDALGRTAPGEEAKVLIEADVMEGIRAVPLSEYASCHTRICRPVGLRSEEIESLIRYAISRLGQQYDLRNIFDLARYLLRTPPVPTRWRRRLLALGSGDPTRAICSSLIAQAFHSIRYPILPEVIFEKATDSACINCHKEILHIRHHSLFAPRDFDVSPYFLIVKPTIESGFDPHAVRWANGESVTRERNRIAA